MIKIENVVTPSPEQWKAAILGARNPLNSWLRSDSKWNDEFELGEKDLELLKKLSAAGTDHRKFMRMLVVYLDVTAPLYFWKEADTYKIGTVANSCSTMHKIASKEFTLNDFSCEHLDDNEKAVHYDRYRRIFNTAPGYTSIDILLITIDALNYWREEYLDTKDKHCWWQMIQLLPSSYNQKRTLMLNYEVLANIYKSRKGHKLDEWNTLCEWIEGLPYAELIVGS